MTISVEEKRDSGLGDIQSDQRRYIVIGTGSDAEIQRSEIIAAVLAEVPNTLEDLALSNISVDEIHLGPARTIAIATAEYGGPPGVIGVGTGTEAESVYEFRYQAPAQHVRFALATTSYGTTPPDIKNKINVTPDGEHLGIDLPAGNTTNVWRRTLPAGSLNSSYESLVEGLVGGVNATPFKGRPAGTMRFVSVDSQLVGSSRQTLTWGFQYSANRTNLTLAGISSVNIGGHEFMWQLDEREVDNGKLVLVPRAIYVQQLFPLVELNGLGI